MITNNEPAEVLTAFDSPTFGQDGSFRVDKPVGSATISPCGRDVALASRQGLHIIDLDSPWSPPRHLAYHTPWEVVDVQWSPFAARDYWVVSTSNQKALVWNLNLHARQGSVEHVLHAHTRAISDINFSAHYPDILATCAVDSFVHCWDLRHPASPAMTFCDWFAGATQVKWNRTNPHILASSHDKFLRIWDDRKGTRPLRSLEAHATKISGIDWNRFNTTNLVTCSPDRTIKLWDYTEDTIEPKRILHTAFPVWRARHTPFGYGLLALPQRGNNDLHLYDRRNDETSAQSILANSAYTFEGHSDQVKEFLWRPRGNVSATRDDRDFQLVSWGADRVLRLHQVTDNILESVGYQKGMLIKSTTWSTRKGAPYKSFRVPPNADEPERSLTAHGVFDGERGPTMRLPPAMDTNKSLYPFTSGTKGGDPRNSSLGSKGKFSQETDPISWMRGVKIGKRSTSQPGLGKSTSALLSPTLRAQPVWDIYESLGEEIAAVGDKFSKIQFDDVDMQRHRLVISLPGPWGPGNTSTWVRVKIGFPAGYPNTAAAVASIEKTTSVPNEVLHQILSDVDSLASAFLTIRRSSLETILRYLLGEQSLDEVLQALQKYKGSDNLVSTQDEQDSSDDDESPSGYGQQQSNSIESIDPLALVNNAQYNVPLPKACGALWAGNGTLVCFFPAKLEKEPSILDQNLKISPRNRSAILEGFGRLHEEVERRKYPTSMLETIEVGDTEFDDCETSSSGSSSYANGNDLPHNHFMPTMAWSGSGLDMFQKVALDESQKSIGENGTAISTSHKTSMFISLHNLSDLLPSKQSLANQYELGDTHLQAAHNASVARSYGYPDIADVWCLIEVILQDKVPVQLLQHPSGNGSIIAIARSALSLLRDKDAGIESYVETNVEDEAPFFFNRVSWGSHPFGRAWIVDALFHYFEQKADLQMLAMMSCIFSKALEATCHQDRDSVRSNLSSKPFCSSSSYYSSMVVATSLVGLSQQSTPRKLLSNPHSTTSSAEVSISEQVATSCESNTPPSYKTLAAKHGRRDSQTTSLSNSPEQHRHIFRSNSNLSAFAASIARPFSFNNSAASSPPNGLPHKRNSPSDSHIGATSSSIAEAFTGLSSKAATRSEDPTSYISLSLSDTEDSLLPVPIDPHTQIHGFTTTLKNQDRFPDEGHANSPLLDAKKEWQYTIYRNAYANLLSMWGLPFARCELLKYSHGSFASTDQARFSQSIPSDGGAEVESTSVVLNAHCVSCGCLLLVNSSRGRCPRCPRISGPPPCMYCGSYIYGVASPCLNCGHMLHQTCRRMLLEMGLLECVSGCGCTCSDHPCIEMPPPEDYTQRHRYRGDVSPAVTVIADAGDNEQEMAGWRGSEWEEMAYESLARNLRGETRGSGRVPRERASSIWRGSSS